MTAFSTGLGDAAMKLLLATFAGLAFATAANAFPLVQNQTETERLRGLLVEQAVACPKVDSAWYMTDPDDRSGRVQVWKVSCSTGQEYGIMLDREMETVMIDSWSAIDKSFN